MERMCSICLLLLADTMSKGGQESGGPNGVLRIYWQHHGLSVCVIWACVLCGDNQKLLDLVEWMSGFVEPLGHIWLVGKNCGCKLVSAFVLYVRCLIGAVFECFVRILKCHKGVVCGPDFGKVIVVSFMRIREWAQVFCKVEVFLFTGSMGHGLYE